MFSIGFFVYLIFSGCSKIEEQVDIGVFFGDDKAPKIVDWSEAKGQSGSTEMGKQENADEATPPEPKAVDPNIEESIFARKEFSLLVRDVARFPQKSLHKRFYTKIIATIKSNAAAEDFFTIDKSSQAHVSHIKCTAAKESVCSAVVSVTFIKPRDIK